MNAQAAQTAAAIRTTTIPWKRPTKRASQAAAPGAVCWIVRPAAEFAEAVDPCVCWAPTESGACRVFEAENPGIWLQWPERHPGRTVTVYDATTGAVEWVGPEAEYLADNDDAPDADTRPMRAGQVLMVGGGAASAFRVEVAD